jgi:hypothetical protein
MGGLFAAAILRGAEGSHISRFVGGDFGGWGSGRLWAILGPDEKFLPVCRSQVRFCKLRLAGF